MSVQARRVIETENAPYGRKVTEIARIWVLRGKRRVVAATPAANCFVGSVLTSKRFWSFQLEGDRDRESSSRLCDVALQARTLEGPRPLRLRHRARRSRWAGLLRRIFEVDPLRCPRCGHDMRIIAFILDAQVIDAILRHLRRNDRDPYTRLDGEIIDVGRAPPE
jgi:hypothetical protein